jgi:hypothetical protein
LVLHYRNGKLVRGWSFDSHPATLAAAGLSE